MTKTPLKKSVAQDSAVKLEEIHTEKIERASQVALENQTTEASQSKLENQTSEASQDSLENHEQKASQSLKENHNEKASHGSLENHLEQASQVDSENQKGKADIRALVEIYYDVQDVRIRSFNRLRQVGEVKGVTPNILKQLENQIKLYIQHKIKKELIWQTYLKGIRGIGPILSGGLISWLDPAKAKHISSFWKYCGLHVKDGHAVKRQKGIHLDYNPKAKLLCWKIADSFIKQRTPFYRDLYDQTKIEDASKLGNPQENPENCPQYSECVKRLGKTASRLKRESKKPSCKKHIDYRARRKMIKRFLSDLWIQWRTLEKLPISEPYAIAILKHGAINNENSSS